MTEELRDYDAWHDAYDDANSSLSWRLGVVQRYIHQALDSHVGPVRVVSACAGDGRDLIRVLSQRADADRVQAALLEVHPGIAGRAGRAARNAALAGVHVYVTDAGRTDSYTGLVPADLVLLVGIFGNISDEDLRRTIAACPMLCSQGATLIWSRGRDLSTGGDRNDQLRPEFADAGFVELEYATRDTGTLPAVGAMRYDGPLRPLRSGQKMFTFIR